MDVDIYMPVADTNLGRRYANLSHKPRMNLHSILLEVHRVPRVHKLPRFMYRKVLLNEVLKLSSPGGSLTALEPLNVGIIPRLRIPASNWEGLSSNTWTTLELNRIEKVPFRTVALPESVRSGEPGSPGADALNPEKV